MSSDSSVPGDDGLGAWYEDARKQVQNPGAALQWFGVASIVLSIIWLVGILVNPDAFVKSWYDRQVRQNRELPPEDRTPLPPYTEYSKQATNYNLVTGILRL